MITNPKISIIICAKNEEKNLPWVLNRINKLIAKLKKTEIIIVDGHSTDRTRKITREFGFQIVSDHGKGKGDAIRVGAEHAHGDVLVFIDADGSHNPNDIKKLLNPILYQNMDHVSGSRMLGGSQELYKNVGQVIRLWGSTIITLLVNYHFKVRLTDCQNGFRAIKKEVFLKLNLRENITTIEQEMVIKTLKKGFKLTEVPTHEYERKFGESHINILKVGPRYIYSCLKYLFF